MSHGFMKDASTFPDEEPHMLKGDSPPLRTSTPRTPSMDHPTQPPKGPILATLTLVELRELRRNAQQEEADLSYLRRLLQGRIDILRAEVGQRTGASLPCALGDANRRPTTLLERLPEILADGPSRIRSSARHVTLGTPRSEEYRRLADEMLGEVGLSDLAALTDDELGQAMRRLVGHEEQVSMRRARLQRAADGCSAEIARRYREGEARIDDLLCGG